MPPPSPLPDLLKNLRDYLVAEGIVRDPRTAGAAPPLFLEPADGSPAPGDREGTEDNATEMLSAFRTGGITPNFVDQRYFRRDTVDLVLRARNPMLANQREEKLRWALIGSGAGDLKMNWQMAALRVIQSTLWRPLQPLDFSGDPPIYTAVVSFYFELYTTGS